MKIQSVTNLKQINIYVFTCLINEFFEEEILNLYGYALNGHFKNTLEVDI